MVMTKRTTILVVVVFLIASILSTIVAVNYLINQPKPTPRPIQSQSSFYLDDSRIFVVYANGSYGKYPFPTVMDFDDSPIAEKGQACIIINVTLRNDYSDEYPPPNSPASYNSSTVFVSLTAELFDGETKVEARDITNASPILSAGTNAAFASFQYGESTSLTLYIATNSNAITSFQFVSRYIGELAPP
jgi:hypothetical protein